MLHYIIYGLWLNFSTHDLIPDFSQALDIWLNGFFLLFNMLSNFTFNIYFNFIDFDRYFSCDNGLPSRMVWVPVMPEWWPFNTCWSDLFGPISSRIYGWDNEVGSFIDHTCMKHYLRKFTDGTMRLFLMVFRFKYRL